MTDIQCMNALQLIQDEMNCKFTMKHMSDQGNYANTGWLTWFACNNANQVAISNQHAKLRPFWSSEGKKLSGMSFVCREIEGFSLQPAAISNSITSVSKLQLKYTITHGVS